MAIEKKKAELPYNFSKLKELENAKRSLKVNFIG